MRTTSGSIPNAGPGLVNEACRSSAGAVKRVSTWGSILPRKGEWSGATTRSAVRSERRKTCAKDALRVVRRAKARRLGTRTDSRVLVSQVDCRGGRGSIFLTSAMTRSRGRVERARGSTSQPHSRDGDGVAGSGERVRSEASQAEQASAQSSARSQGRASCPPKAFWVIRAVASNRVAVFEGPWLDGSTVQPDERQVVQGERAEESARKRSASDRGRQTSCGRTRLSQSKDAEGHEPPRADEVERPHQPARVLDPAPRRKLPRRKTAAPEDGNGSANCTPRLAPESTRTDDAAR